LGFWKLKAAVTPSSRQSITVPTTCMSAPGSMRTVTPGAAETSSSHLALESEEGKEGEGEKEREVEVSVVAARLGERKGG